MLNRRAKQQVKYQLDWNIAAVDMGLTYQYIGSRYDTNETYQRTKVGGVSIWDPPLHIQSLHISQFVVK